MKQQKNLNQLGSGLKQGQRFSVKAENIPMGDMKKENKKEMEKKKEKKQQRIMKNLETLIRLKRGRRLAVQKAMIRDGNKDMISSIVEIIHNLLASKVPLKDWQRKQLGRHAETLRKLAKVRNEKIARNMIIQHGGSIMPLLTGPILAAIVALLSN